MISLVYSPEYAKHHTGTHPENQRRLESIMNYLQEEGELEKLDIQEPVPASSEDILRVHTPHHLNYLKSFSEKGGGYLDFDTFASPQSYEIARLAAGGAIKASELVLNQDYDFAYSLARPPGHHATGNRAMGFCLINNLAVALEYVRKRYGLKKFIIFDFDAHYGNGTAEIFYHDPQILYISIHQDPHTIFPGEGFIEEMGSGEGKGFNLNIPMPPGSKTSDYIYILEKILETAYTEFKADFSFLDVGFDGHMEDPLSSLHLDDNFYPWIGCHLQKLTPKMVLVLEGGYCYDAMARSNLKMIKVLRDKITNEDRWQAQGELKVKDEIKRIFKKIQDTFSPYFTF
ncbi:MAG: histone deacetylase [Methanobacteriaceae archaeon]|nr:histone deacetylase [Methanobacteriaceae archaeon]